MYRVSFDINEDYSAVGPVTVVSTNTIPDNPNPENPIPVIDERGGSDRPEEVSRKPTLVKSPLEPVVVKLPRKKNAVAGWIDRTSGGHILAISVVIWGIVLFVIIYCLYRLLQLLW